MHPRQRRKFTEEEKKAIVKQALERGTNTILHEYRLSYSVFSRWKSSYESQQIVDPKFNIKILQRLKDLIQENNLLKKIIANQALEIQIEKEKLRTEKKDGRISN